MIVECHFIIGPISKDGILPLEDTCKSETGCLLSVNLLSFGILFNKYKGLLIKLTYFIKFDLFDPLQ